MRTVLAIGNVHDMIFKTSEIRYRNRRVSSSPNWTNVLDVISVLDSFQELVFLVMRWQRAANGSQSL